MFLIEVINKKFNKVVIEGGLNDMDEEITKRKLVVRDNTNICGRKDVYGRTYQKDSGKNDVCYLIVTKNDIVFYAQAVEYKNNKFNISFRDNILGHKVADKYTHKSKEHLTMFGIKFDNDYKYVVGYTTDPQSEFIIDPDGNIINEKQTQNT